MRLLAHFSTIDIWSSALPPPPQKKKVFAQYATDRDINYVPGQPF